MGFPFGILDLEDSEVSISFIETEIENIDIIENSEVVLGDSN